MPFPMRALAMTATRAWNRIQVLRERPKRHRGRPTEGRLLSADSWRAVARDLRMLLISLICDPAGPPVLDD